MARHLQLPDGRNLDYQLSGARDGFPLLWIHGTPGAYTVFPDLNAACAAKGLKLITMSRAGYGGSTRQRGRRVVDMVQDLQRLTQHLNVERCLVAGWSGGGPHALACAARLPACVAALVIAGPGPWDAQDLDFLQGQGNQNIKEFRAALDGEEQLFRFCEICRPAMIKGDVQEFVDAMSTILPDVDSRALLENASLSHFLVKNIQEGLRNSSGGWVDDGLAFIQPWGFKVDEIEVPVVLYQGSDDKMVPFSHGEWLARNIPLPVSRPYFLQGHGHISVFIDHLHPMLDALLQYR